MGKSERIEAELLDRCLSELEQGQAASEPCREENLDLAQSTQSLVDYAQELVEHLAPDGPSQVFVEASTTRIINLLSAKQGREKKPTPGAGQLPNPIWALRPALVLVGALLVILVVASGAGAAYAASDALPGDPLYGLKRGLEEANLGLTFSTEGDLDRLSGYANLRLDEIDLLLEANRIDDALQGLDTYQELNQRASKKALQALEAGRALDLIEFQNQLEQQQARLFDLAQSAPAPARTSLESALMQNITARNNLDHGENESKRPEATPSSTVAIDLPGHPTPKASTGDRSDQGQAEAIANQNQVQIEAVWEIYEAQCQQDWGCVRQHYRDQKDSGKDSEKEGQTAARLADQFGVAQSFVFNIFSEECEQDWQCVRQVLRNLEQGQPSPSKTPKPKNNNP